MTDLIIYYLLPALFFISMGLAVWLAWKDSR